MFQFPFPAIIGQIKLKTAYLANIINPHIGGLLISGPKGTGKSTIVHSVKSMLPEYTAVDGCEFHCDPATPHRFCHFCQERSSIHESKMAMTIITLPLSCTEDRLIGSIDIEKLLKEGKKEFQPGILGEANRNILYIDEVNLLPDHLVDDILDAAASHWNTVEREGISISHPTDFVLVGTMNPEEGDLRPQILDRFPLCVKIHSITDPRQRMEIIRRNIYFEEQPDAFHRLFEAESASLKAFIQQSRDIMATVSIHDRFLFAVSSACSELKVDGQRPDMVIVKTAQTLAAMNHREEVQPEDIVSAAEFTLIHRTRDGGLLEPPAEQTIIDVFRTHLHRQTGNPETTRFSMQSFSVDKSLDTFIEDCTRSSESNPLNKNQITPQMNQSTSGDQKKNPKIL